MTRYRMMTVLAAMATTCVAPSRAQSAPMESPPRPGQLVDVGGWRLHLYCTGEAKPSQPTVILEAGLGNFSVEGSLVQPKLAEFVRVCSYDRAGSGWSDLGPHPRTMRQIAYELHVLLKKAGVRPPYVLVGQSLGAWLVRFYASTYPTEVAGMVLVEGGFDNPWRMVNGKVLRSADLVTGKPVPDLKTSGPLKESDIPPDALNRMKTSAAASIHSANEPPRNKLPVPAQQARKWALSRWQHLAAYVNPFEAEELAFLRAERVKGGYPLADVPLVVLTRGIPDEDGPDGKAVELERRKKEHAELAQTLSRKGRQIIAVHSGHHIHLDEPNLVVDAVRDVVVETRK